MNFAAGMGAGMAAGMGAGIAAGIGAGKKQACQQIRNHVSTNAMTIHDRAGKVVDVESFLADAVQDAPTTSQKRTLLLAILVLLGVVSLGVLSYLVFF